MKNLLLAFLTLSSCILTSCKKDTVAAKRYRASVHFYSSPDNGVVSIACAGRTTQLACSIAPGTSLSCVDYYKLNTGCTVAGKTYPVIGTIDLYLAEDTVVTYTATSASGQNFSGTVTVSPSKLCAFQNVAAGTGGTSGTHYGWITFWTNQPMGTSGRDNIRVGINGVQVAITGTWTNVSGCGTSAPLGTGPISLPVGSYPYSAWWYPSNQSITSGTATVTDGGCSIILIR